MATAHSGFEDIDRELERRAKEAYVDRITSQFKIEAASDFRARIESDIEKRSKQLSLLAADDPLRDRVLDQITDLGIQLAKLNRDLKLAELEAMPAVAPIDRRKHEVAFKATFDYGDLERWFDDKPVSYQQYKKWKAGRGKDDSDTNKKIVDLLERRIRLGSRMR